jgi:glycerol-3-phosphate O-acyltransferase 1/2
VLDDDHLKQAIEQVTQDAILKIEEQKRQNPDDDTPNPTYKEVYTANETRVKTIIKIMGSTLSDFLLRLTSWTLYKLLPYFLTSIAASPTQLEMLKKAGDTGLPLIFMPLHRSHLDYILVTFILLNNNIRSPQVAAGDNLKIPLFGY